MTSDLHLDLQIRDVTRDDHAWIVEVNNAAVPAVSPFTLEQLPGYFAMTAWARIAEWRGVRAGLAFGLLPGRDYDCENYVWFRRRLTDFLYIDRIVVAPEAQGAGVGRLLYADAVRFASGRVQRLVCEVNERPPNPQSMRFHDRWGFCIVGRQSTEGGAKSVALMAKRLSESTV